MVQSNSFSVTVRNRNEKPDAKPYFDRVVNTPSDDFDINIVVQALRMLFNSDIFQITISTYGA